MPGAHKARPYRRHKVSARLVGAWLVHARLPYGHPYPLLPLPRLDRRHLTRAIENDTQLFVVLIPRP